VFFRVKLKVLSVYVVKCSSQMGPWNYIEFGIFFYHLRLRLNLIHHFVVNYFVGDSPQKVNFVVGMCLFSV